MAQYLLGLYEKAMPNQFTLPEKLAAAKKLGYDYVELSIDETDQKLQRLTWTKSERLALVKAMYDAALPIRSICLSGHRKYPLGSNDPATVARSLEIMEQAIELADDLGVRTIQLAGYDVYYEQGSAETKKRFTENILRSSELAARHPGRVGVYIGFVPPLARRIYAGADLFLMPSKSEPCGLSQMVACRYGTVPIVRETGGLRDSIQDSGNGEGNGFTFAQYNAHDLYQACWRAKEGYWHKEGWQVLVRRAMESDFSWDASAQRYMEMYQQTMNLW